MMRFFRRAVEFLKVSNHWKHVAGGMAVALAAMVLAAVTGRAGVLCVYAGLVAACCLELKDRMWGGLWDWADWWCTVAGAAAAVLMAGWWM